MHTVQILNRLVEDHQLLAYGLIFLGLIFEGEVTLISAGVLAHLGALDFMTTLGFVFGGALIKTLIGYRIGKYLGKYRERKVFAFIEKRVLSVIPRFRERPFWSIFLSKFVMGLNYMVVIFSGYQKINFQKYLKAEILSTIIWAPLLLSLGYFFSFTAIHISREVGKFLLLVVAFTLVFLLVDKLLGLLYAFLENLKNNTNDKKEQ